MKPNPNFLALAFSVWVFTGAARAAGSDADTNPYHAIVTHNVFGLTPPPRGTAELDIAPPPPEIVLNGIMDVFDRNFALFKIHAGGGKTYLLAEGQSDGEVELLAVNANAGTIRIKNHGVVQTVALAKPPAPASAPPNAPSPAGVAPATVANNSQAPAANISLPQTGNVPDEGSQMFQGGSVVAGAVNPGSANPLSAGNSGAQDSGSSDLAAKPPEPWWMIGSKNIEASRIATAALVESGQADPYPLTPYTQPGTPAALIGPGQLYFVPSAMAN